MDINFEPVEHNTVSDEIIKRLISLINTGKLLPGSKLPSERELMEKFQVSRSSVREALHALTTIGLLETFPGAGTFVSKQLSDVIAGQMEWSIFFGNQELLELTEVREPLEIQATVLAAQRSTPESIHRLRTAIARFTDAAHGDFDSFMDAEMEIHMAIVEMAGNRTLARIIQTFQNVLRNYRKAHKIGFSYSANSLDEYNQILRAIEAGDEDAARAGMVRHLQKSKQQALVDQINEHSEYTRTVKGGS